jgi:hypothetical protein
MSSEEITKLKTRLDYWMEHNKEHSQELQQWAGQAQGKVDAETHQDMLRAAQAMDQASEYLSQALARLGG